jgi:hypothetical protein
MISGRKDMSLLISYHGLQLKWQPESTVLCNLGNFIKCQWTQNGGCGGGVAKGEPLGRSLISRPWVPYKDMKDARDEICRLEVCFGPSHSYLHRGLCQLAAVLKGRL